MSQIILDSGSAYSYIRSVDYDVLIQHLFKDLDCTYGDNEVTCDCDGDSDPSFPDMIITLDGKEFTIKPRYYMEETSSGKCDF